MRYKIGVAFCDGSINSETDTADGGAVTFIETIEDCLSSGMSGRAFNRVVEELDGEFSLSTLQTLMKRILYKNLSEFDDSDVESLKELVSALNFTMNEYSGEHCDLDAISLFVLLPISETVDVATNTIVKTAQKKVWSL